LGCCDDDAALLPCVDSRRSRPDSARPSSAMRVPPFSPFSFFSLLRA
jgi:hypothetical protein